VVFPPACRPIPVEDSKLLPESKRLSLLDEIEQSALSIGIGTANPAEIDQINIYQATLLSMRRAVEQLELVPQHLLVDARHIPGIKCPQTAIIRGDRRCFSIAAASIIAKTYRDRLMADYDSQFPQYGFRSHKGYPTASHREAIQRFGPCSIHRHSFRLLDQEKNLQPSLFSLE
jgi:ribonuclease HII